MRVRATSLWMACGTAALVAGAGWYVADRGATHVYLLPSELTLSGAPAAMFGMLGRRPGPGTAATLQGRLCLFIPGI